MKKILELGIGALLFWGCNNSETRSTSESTTVDVESHEYGSSLAIELNDGEKWTVNEEMKPFVVKGAEIVDAYIDESRSDHKTLAEQLNDQNNQLIKSCTMTGKSHDELHKWLHPHLDLVKSLANETETDPVGVAEIVLQLQDSYRKYQRYFD